ncbi:hypothetical protein C8F01DRAFT_1242628 [Mycena amicta]|nr:hypothetical protein C8F01DRAFT_1242628 [Mycena amicta]
MNSLNDATAFVTDGVWLYPITGILYCASNFTLVRPLVSKILVTALAITSALFFFAYLPHVALCSILGPFAFSAAATMVLGEAYALSMFVTKAFFLDQAQEQLFNAVFRQKGVPLVYVVQKNRSRSFLQNATKLLRKPLGRFSREGILRYVVSLPLNLVPVVGTFLFLLYNGMLFHPWPR